MSKFPVKQTVGFNWKIFQIDHLDFKLEFSFIFKDRLSGYFKIHEKTNLV